ncbi:uncharacterized protein LOC127061098 [Serinus canaria]|uniref:uncharacterized protein LOC127061098 n=1 Tax=Serinus canaria TaxID=9135 RepID=UPI0021CCE9AF|nr:uncharacterized protein LOC127061098 [Serinus canaria]
MSRSRCCSPRCHGRVLPSHGEREARGEALGAVLDRPTGARTEQSPRRAANEKLKGVSFILAGSKDWTNPGRLTSAKFLILPEGLCIPQGDTGDSLLQNHLEGKSRELCDKLQHWWSFRKQRLHVEGKIPARPHCRLQRIQSRADRAQEAVLAQVRLAPPSWAGDRASHTSSTARGCSDSSAGDCRSHLCGGISRIPVQERLCWGNPAAGQLSAAPAGTGGARAGEGCSEHRAPEPDRAGAPRGTGSLLPPAGPCCLPRPRLFPSAKGHWLWTAAAILGTKQSG